MTTQPSCSIARTLEYLRDRWTFLILREAHLGTTRFADFRDYLGIAPNILTNHLNDLVDSGLLEADRHDRAGSLEPPARTDRSTVSPAGRHVG